MDTNNQDYSNQEPQERVSPFADSPYVNYNSAAPGPAAGQSWQPEQKQKKEKRSGKVWKGVLAAVLAVVIVGGTCGATALSVNSYWEKKSDQMNRYFQEKLKAIEEQSSNSGTIQGNPVSTSGAKTVGQVYAENVNSVVAISNQTTTNIFGQVSQTASSGSGFILSEDGYVVTNYHVVSGATKLTVITADSQEYEAKLVGYDKSNDIAVLKIAATGLRPVTIGSSDALSVGDQVVAIGNPLGELTNTLTAGYVSAKGRTVSTEGSQMEMLQTDAAINPGNSGGPLFNMKGEVIGITTAKYSGTTSSGASIEGIGFAIPIDDVLSMVEDLRDHGYITGAYLGIMVKDMNASLAEAYGLPVGVYVDSVSSGSCAEKGGMRAGDIILELGGYETTSSNKLGRALRKFDAGDEVTVKVLRSGREVLLSITLDEKPKTEQEQQEVQQPQNPEQSQLPSNGDMEDWFEHFFGGGNG